MPCFLGGCEEKSGNYKKILYIQIRAYPPKKARMWIKNSLSTDSFSKMWINQAKKDFQKTKKQAFKGDKCEKSLFFCG